MHLQIFVLIALAIVNSVITYPSSLSSDGTFFPEERYDNPDERGSDFEGDIVLRPEQLKQLMSGQKDTNRRWPKKQLIYQISNDFTQSQRAAIVKATNMISSVTCVTFRPRTNEKTYVSILRGGNSCNSVIGMDPPKFQPQKMHLADWCAEKSGSIAHEFIHALGFWHEHTRPDRDKYVIINQQNVQTDYGQNFDIHNANEATTFNVKYDLGSIMHYSEYAFANNTKIKTITPRKPFNGEIGQRKKLSEKDIKNVRAMYKC